MSPLSKEERSLLKREAEEALKSPRLDSQRQLYGLILRLLEMIPDRDFPKVRAKPSVPELAYHNKAQHPEKGWDKIAEEHEYMDARSVYSAVQRWARVNNAPWPLPSTTLRRSRVRTQD